MASRASLAALLSYALALYLAYRSWQAYSLRRRRRSHGCQPARRYPHAEPFFGLDLFFRRGQAISEQRYLPQLDAWYSEYGATFEAQSFGVTAINTIEPENIKTVYSTRFADWGVQPVRLPVMRAFCGEGFLTADGAAWDFGRALLKPSFRRVNISDLSALEDHLQLLLARIPADGATVDLQPLLFDLCLDTATLFLFGEPLGKLSGRPPAHARGFLEAFEAGFDGCGIRIALGPLKFLVPKAKWLESCRTTHRFADHYVDRALQKRAEAGEKKHGGAEKGPRNVLDAMAEQTDDRDALRSQSVQALMAAQEPTAILLSNAVFHLARHPACWRALRDEVLALGEGKPKWDQLGQLPYLRNVLNESQSPFSFSLNPVTPLIRCRSAPPHARLPAVRPHRAARHRAAHRRRRRRPRAHLLPARHALRHGAGRAAPAPRAVGRRRGCLPA